MLFYQTMEKSVNRDRDARLAMLKYLDYSMLESEKYGLLFTPAESYGVSVWSKPITHELSIQKNKQKQAFILSEMGEKSLQTYLEIVKTMSKNAESLIGEDDWYLSIVGVNPEYQGQGLGKKLIEPILSESDSLNIDTYLETFTPRNMTFYQRLGYEEVGNFFLPITNASYSIMKRRAN